jgi:hypothetical protein
VSFHQKGVNYQKDDPKVCMVADCHKKALYVNVSSYSCRKTGRGYCEEHKSLAVPTGAAYSKTTEDYYAHDSDKEPK